MAQSVGLLSIDMQSSDMDLMWSEFKLNFQFLKTFEEKSVNFSLENFLSKKLLNIVKVACKLLVFFKKIIRTLVKTVFFSAYAPGQQKVKVIFLKYKDSYEK